MSTMPAGRYYVGDLCYVMHDVWDEVCDLMFPYDGRGVYGKFTLKDGRQFAVHSTAYGDGTYRDGSGREYSVDAGVIGCILADDIHDPIPQIHGGNVLEFHEEFEVSGEDGMIRFGHIVIDTDPEFNEEFDQEDYY